MYDGNLVLIIVFTAFMIDSCSSMSYYGIDDGFCSSSPIMEFTKDSLSIQNYQICIIVNNIFNHEMHHKHYYFFDVD
jgi:hypothetical protein